MGILIDVILIAIVILNVAIGYKKGLINVIFNICAFLIAILVTLILYKPVSNLIINNTDIDNRIKEVIINNNQVDENSENESSEEEKTEIQKYVESKVNDVEDTAKAEAIEIVADIIAKTAIEILTAILLFIITRILVIILKAFSEGLSKIPIIKQCNQVGGIAYGLLKAIIIIYLLLTILFLVVSINGNGTISKAIEDSTITKVLYENNIIVKYCFLGKNLL